MLGGTGRVMNRLSAVTVGSTVGTGRFALVCDRVNREKTRD
jgi:hypothetical protein